MSEPASYSAPTPGLPTPHPATEGLGQGEARQVSAWCTVCVLLQGIGAGGVTFAVGGEPAGAPFGTGGGFTALEALAFLLGAIGCLTAPLVWILCAILWANSRERFALARELYHAVVVATFPAYLAAAVLRTHSERLGLERVPVVPGVSLGWTTLVTAFCSFTLLAFAWRGYRRPRS